MTIADRSPVGVVLFNLGGPEDLDAVEPFLTDLFADREIIQLPFGAAMQPLFARFIARLRGPSVRRNYALIGGGSPQLRITREQAAALEQRLNRPRPHGTKTRPFSFPSPAWTPPERFRVFIAMRYAKPTAQAAITQMEAEGVRRVITLPLYPHWSKATTGSSQRAFSRALEVPGWHKNRFAITHIDRYADDRLYLDALADTIRRAHARLSPEGRRDGVILFSAHGLPRRFIDEGDPYVEQIEATWLGLAKRLNLPNRQVLGYQSRTGPVKWIGPGTDELIERLGAEGVKQLLVVPLSFVSDHIETLYEIDILFRDIALKAGIEEYVRPEALNTQPMFIEALARLVERHWASCQVRPDALQAASA